METAGYGPKDTNRLSPLLSSSLPSFSSVVTSRARGEGRNDRQGRRGKGRNNKRLIDTRRLLQKKGKLMMSRLVSKRLFLPGVFFVFLDFKLISV